MGGIGVSQGLDHRRRAARVHFKIIKCRMLSQYDLVYESSFPLPIVLGFGL